LKVCAALSNVSTMGDPRVERAYREVLTMCERVGDDAQVVPALLGIVRFHHVRGDVAAGHSVAERALKVARAVGDPVLLVQALHHVGVSYCAAGLFREASELTTEAVETSRQLPSDAALVTSGFSPTAAAMIVQSWTYWFLGHADRAVGSAREALALAEDLAHLQTLAFVKSFGAVTLTFCGMLDEAQAWAESSLALAGQCDFLFATAFAEGVLAWIRSRRGHSSGVDELRHAIDMQHRMGMLVWVPMMKAWLAESLLRAGKPQAAVAAVDEGLETARQTGSRFYDAELHGVRAEALAAGGATAGDDTDTRSQCEALLEQSFEIAADQEAKALQLRAAMRLARLSTTDDALNAARRLLAHTYTRFSEGFSTGDMSDARTLLDPQ
jgi:predicted ATPase